LRPCTATSETSIERTADDRDSALRELGGHCVGVLHPDCQLEGRPRLRYRHGTEQLVHGGASLQQVEEEVVELEGDRVLVLEDGVDLERSIVELLRPLRVLDEQRDCTNTLERLAHLLHPFR